MHDVLHALPYRREAELSNVSHYSEYSFVFLVLRIGIAAHDINTCAIWSCKCVGIFAKRCALLNVMSNLLYEHFLHAHRVYGSLEVGLALCTKDLASNVSPVFLLE